MRKGMRWSALLVGGVALALMGSGDAQTRPMENAAVDGDGDGNGNGNGNGNVNVNRNGDNRRRQHGRGRVVENHLAVVPGHPCRRMD